MSPYKCESCSSEFKTRSGLWKHNQNKHNIITELKHCCKFCEKELSNRHSRWRHENYTCKKNPEISTNNISVSIGNNNTISNSVINSNNITNTVNITFNKLGHEDVSSLTQDEIKIIVDSGFNSIIKLIEFINFNINRPENHTFCTTSLNNKYASVLNTETNTIEKHRKVDIFDKVLIYALNHIDMMIEYIRNKKIKKDFQEKINDLEKKVYGDSQYRKIVNEQLNALSYNKRTVINNTWDNYFKEYIGLII
jgi:hypothetical protein